MAGRAAYLIAEREVPAASMLAITFTTAAAATLRGRLATVLGPTATYVDIRTFHSFGLKVIRSWSAELGFGHMPPVVYGRDETRAILRQAAQDLGLELAPDQPIGEPDPWALSAAKLARSLDRFRLSGLETASSWQDADGLDDAVLSQLAEAYETLLRKQAAVDYAAMLVMPLRLFESEPRALRMLQDAYRHVLVDEVQDTCRVQYAILQSLAARHRNLALVGDPLQSVYGFRGADPSLLQAFPRDYPDARVFVLDENHRSTATIVTLANAIAAPLASRPASWTSNPQGPSARLYCADDDAGEARFVADEISRLLVTGAIARPGQVGVLFRTNAQARGLADALRRRAIPVQMRPEQDLFTRAEIGDMLAYLRLAHNLTDVPALARILDTPPRRLRAVERAFRKKPVPVAELPDYAQKRGGTSARAAVETLFALLEELHGAAEDQAPVKVLEAALDCTGYAVWLAAQSDGPARLQQVELLHASLEQTAAPDLATWLTDLHLGESDPVPNDNAVNLLTVHGSKGREWPVVFVVGVEEGLLPHLRFGGEAEPDDAEERRLTYVALSRCQVQLYLTYCRARRPLVGGQPGRPEARRPSRYLRALPAPLMEPVA